MANWLEKNSTVAKILLGTFAALAVAVISVSVATTAAAAATKIFAAATKIAAAAQWAFNAAAEVNPYVLLATAVVVLVAGIVILLRHFHLLDDVWNAIVTAGQKVVTFFTTTLPNAFQTAITWVQNNWPKIIVALTGPFGIAFYALVTDAFGIRSRLQNAITAVIDWVKTNWPKIIAVLSGPFGAAVYALATDMFGVRSRMQTAISAITTFVSDKVKDIAGFFTGLPGKIGDFGSALLARITNFIDNAGIGKFLTGKVQDFADFFKALPRTIGAAIGGAIGDLKDALARIFDWHKILGWIKDALGFGSPAAWAVGIGKDIVGSIAHGVGESADVLKDAVWNLAKKIPGVGAVAGAVGGALKPSGTQPIGTIQSLVKNYLDNKGWGGYWGAIDAIFTRESNWNPDAINKNYAAGAIPPGAGGVAQANPYTKMEPKAWPNSGDPMRGLRQAIWGINYMFSTYGNPAKAWDFWQRHNAYAKGGIFTKPTLGLIGEAGPEAVVPLNRGIGPTINVTVQGSVVTERQLHDTIYRELVRRAGRNAGNMGFMPR
jgi:hypothetical protein